MAIETDYAVHPGEFLRDWMQERGRTQQELAQDMGVSRKYVNALLGGGNLSPDMAARLALVTGYSADWWLKVEAQYQADKARIAQQRELAAYAGRIPANVARFLRAEGFMKATKKNPGLLVAEIFAFFGVASVDALEGKVHAPAAAFRQQFVNEIDDFAVAAWLRAGYIEAEDALRQLPEFDAAALTEVAESLPQLSCAAPDEYRHEVARRLQSVGVALVHVPEIAGCRAHGVTRWFGSNPLIQLSGRGKSDDEYWFSLMHEIHHVLNDSHEELLMQGPAGAKSDPREVAADESAARMLVPHEFVAQLRDASSLEDARILSRDIGIAPGIVVGRLQHDGLWPYTWGNALKKNISFDAGADGL